MATKVVSQSIMDAFARVLGLLDQTQNELDSAIGQLGTLTTVEKTDVVGAVNEVNETSVSKLAKDQVTFDLSYQMLAPTNRGCVVEGGYLPVYQLVDPKFDFKYPDYYTTVGGDVVVTPVIDTVNAPAGEIRHPKPTDFEVLPESEDVTVSYEPTTRRVTVNVPRPASESVTYTLRMKGGSNEITIVANVSVVMTPSMYVDQLYIVTNGTGNEGVAGNRYGGIRSQALYRGYGLDIFAQRSNSTVYDFSQLDYIEIVLKHPTTQKVTDDVYEHFRICGHTKSPTNLADLYEHGILHDYNLASREFTFRLNFNKYTELKSRGYAPILTIFGPKGKITNELVRLSVYDKSGNNHTVTLPNPVFGESIKSKS